MCHFFANWMLDALAAALTCTTVSHERRRPKHFRQKMYDNIDGHCVADDLATFDN